MQPRTTASTSVVTRPARVARPLCGLVALGTALLVGGCSRQPPARSQSQLLRLGVQRTAEAERVLTEILSTEPLIVPDWNGRPVGRLAESWEWSLDGLSLTVSLRANVTFHDGTQLTAPAVAAILRKNLKRDRSEGFRYLTAIEAPSDSKIVFRLSRADSFLVEAIAGSLVRDDANPLLRTGPFRIAPSTEGLLARKNADYYRGEPGLDRVEVTFYDTQRAVFAAIIRGAVDMVPEVNPESVEFLQGGSQIETFASVRPFYIPLVFNLRHPILRNPEVRRALSQAIDREEIVRQAMRGHGRVAEDPVWPAHWAYNAASKRQTYDPAAARARLDAAGLPVRPSTGDAMASRFQLRCLFYNRDFQFERIAILLQRQLEDVGVDLVLTGVGQDELVKRAASGDFDSYVFQLTSGKSSEWIYRFWHSQGGMQSTGYTGADAELDRLRVSRTDADTRLGIAAVRRRFYEDVPAAFLAWPETTRAVSSRFDIGDHDDPDVFGNLWRWHVGPTQSAAR